MKTNLDFYDDFGGTFTLSLLRDKDARLIVNEQSAHSVAVSYNAQTFVLDIFKGSGNGFHVQSFKLCDEVVDNSICIASDLKTIKLLQTPDDTGSIMYMSEKLKSEIQRLRIEKAKLEQSAKLKAGLRKDIETKVPALKLNKAIISPKADQQQQQESPKSNQTSTNTNSEQFPLPITSPGRKRRIGGPTNNSPQSSPPHEILVPSLSTKLTREATDSFLDTKSPRSPRDDGKKVDFSAGTIGRSGGEGNSRPPSPFFRKTVGFTESPKDFPASPRSPISPREVESNNKRAEYATSRQTDTKNTSKSMSESPHNHLSDSLPSPNKTLNLSQKDNQAFLRKAVSENLAPTSSHNIELSPRRNAENKNPRKNSESLLSCSLAIVEVGDVILFDVASPSLYIRAYIYSCEDEDMRTFLFKIKSSKFNKKNDSYVFSVLPHEITVKHEEGVLFLIGDRKSDSSVFRGCIKIPYFTLRKYMDLQYKDEIIKIPLQNLNGSKLESGYFSFKLLRILKVKADRAKSAIFTPEELPPSRTNKSTNNLLSTFHFDPSTQKEKSTLETASSGTIRLRKKATEIMFDLDKDMKNQKDIFMQSKKPPKKQKETIQQELELENKEKEKEFVERVVKVVSHFVPEELSKDILSDQLKGDLKREATIFSAKIQNPSGMMNRKGSREGDQKTLVSVGLFPDPLDFHSLRESLSFKLPEAILDYLTEINGLVLSIVADFETKKSTLSSKSLHPILGKLQKVCTTLVYSQGRNNPAKLLLHNVDIQPKKIPEPILAVEAELTNWMKSVAGSGLSLTLPPAFKIPELHRNARKFFNQKLIRTILQYSDLIVHNVSVYLACLNNGEITPSICSTNAFSALGLLVSIKEVFVTQLSIIDSILKHTEVAPNPKLANIEDIKQIVIEFTRKELEPLKKKVDMSATVKVDMSATLKAEDSSNNNPLNELKSPSTMENMIYRILSCDKEMYKQLTAALLTYLQSPSADIERMYLLIEQFWNMARDFPFSYTTIYVRLEYLILEFVKNCNETVSEDMLPQIRQFIVQNKLSNSTEILNILDFKAKIMDFLPRVSILNNKINIWNTSAMAYYLNVTHFSCRKIAETLTIIDWEIYSKITAKELRLLEWEKPLPAALGHNVNSLIKRMNDIAYWVATSILINETEMERALVKRHFVVVAKFLLKLNNFNSFVGICVGLNNASVIRLKKTEALFQKNYASESEMYENLLKVQDPTGNYKSLRARITSTGTHLIPYIATTCSDLTLIDEANTNMIDGAINYPKFDMISRAIKGFLQYTTVHNFIGSLVPEEPLLSLLRILPKIGKDELYNTSLLREPKLPWI